MRQWIFVTGVTGFIGQELVRSQAIRANYSIKALTRRRLPENGSKDGLQQIVGDLLDPDTYRAALSGCDAVVHLAAITGRAAPKEYQRINVDGTAALLQACKTAGVRRFLHVSTIAAGYPDKRYYAYAQTKARAEALVRESGLDFAIVRPTLVLGEKSPIWNTLLKIAKLPVVPLPEGARSVLVQPIHVDDVVRGIGLTLASGQFGSDVLELGGPRPLPFREFLGLTQEALRGRRGRIVRVPLAPIQALLAVMEPAIRRLMPVTAGQLSVFGNDSALTDNWLMAQLRPDMPSTEETIARLVDTGKGGLASCKDTPRRERQVRPVAENAKRVLEEECRSLGAYLVGAAPSPYVVEQYALAVHAHGLAYDGDFTRFDRVTLGLARKGHMLARCADAYCAIFHRRGALRRKLIVLAAILEHVAPTSDAFDRVEPRHAAFTISLLAYYGCVAALSVLLGAVVLLPASIVCWMATRRTGRGMDARQAQ